MMHMEIYCPIHWTIVAMVSLIFATNTPTSASASRIIGGKAMKKSSRMAWVFWLFLPLIVSLVGCQTDLSDEDSTTIGCMEPMQE